MKVRLSGIDAPESDQPFSSDAREFLLSLIKGKDVQLQCDGVSYDRKTCAIFVGTLDVQESMVRNGWALDYPQYSNGKYRKAEKIAKANKLGIWKTDKSMSPYCWKYTGTSECKVNNHYQP